MNRRKAGLINGEYMRRGAQHNMPPGPLAGEWREQELGSVSAHVV